MVPDVYAMSAGADRVGRQRPVDRLAVTQHVERPRARGHGVADHEDLLEGGQLRPERVEVGEVVEVAEAVRGHEHARARLPQDEVDLLLPVEVHDRERARHR